MPTLTLAQAAHTLMRTTIYLQGQTPKIFFVFSKRIRRGEEMSALKRIKNDQKSLNYVASLSFDADGPLCVPNICITSEEDFCQGVQLRMFKGIVRHFWKYTYSCACGALDDNRNR